MLAERPIWGYDDHADERDGTMCSVFGLCQLLRAIKNFRWMISLQPLHPELLKPIAAAIALCPKSLGQELKLPEGKVWFEARLFFSLLQFYMFFCMFLQAKLILGVANIELSVLPAVSAYFAVAQVAYSRSSAWPGHGGVARSSGKCHLSGRVLKNERKWCCFDFFFCVCVGWFWGICFLMFVVFLCLVSVVFLCLSCFCWVFFLGSDERRGRRAFGWITVDCGRVGNPPSGSGCLDGLAFMLFYSQDIDMDWTCLETCKSWVT